MAQKPEWAKRRNVGGAWFAHDNKPRKEKPRFRKRTFNGKDEFKRWDYLKNDVDTTPWTIEKGGNRFEKPGITRRRKKDAIKPDEQRLRDKIRKEKLAARTLEVRQVEIAHQMRPHGYKDIISWELDRLHAKVPRKPVKPHRPLLVQNTKGRVERMTKETAAEMRSSKNRFFCEPTVDPARQKKLQAGGLYHPRKASVLGNSTDSKNVVNSYGVADALTHSVYNNGKALKPEWDLQPVEPEDWNAPQWYGKSNHVATKKPATAPAAPKWWPKGK